MAAPKDCQVTVSWPAEDGRSVDDVVIYNIESDVDESQLPPDMLDNLTDLFLVSPDSELLDDSPCPPCTARIAFQDSGPGRHLALAAVDVLSSARNIEVFSNTGEYLVLAEGTRLDVAGVRKLYLSQHTFDQPQASCQLKFLSLVDPGRLWLHSLHVTLAVSCVDPAFPIALGPVIDMDKVTAIMADMDTDVPDRAKGLMNAMTSIQKSKKQTMGAFGSILSGGSQGPPTMAGIMGMFASMGMGSNTPPTTPQHAPAPSTHPTTMGNRVQTTHSKGQTDNSNSGKSKSKKKSGKRGQNSNGNEEHDRSQTAGQESNKQKSQNKDQHKGQNKDQQKCQNKDQLKGPTKDQQKSKNKDQQKSQNKEQQKCQNKDQAKEQNGNQQKCQNKDQHKGENKDPHKGQNKDQQTGQNRDHQKCQKHGQSKGKQKTQNKGQHRDQVNSASTFARTSSTDTDSEQSGCIDMATDDTGSGASYASSDGISKPDQKWVCSCGGNRQVTDANMLVTRRDLKALEQRLVQRIDEAQAAILDEITSRMADSEQRIVSHMDSLLSKMAAMLLGDGPAMNGAANQVL